VPNPRKKLTISTSMAKELHHRNFWNPMPEGNPRTMTDKKNKLHISQVVLGLEPKEHANITAKDLSGPRSLHTRLKIFYSRKLNSVLHWC